jgi:beta-lactamase superfamily II metal-dependent hydrolase
MITVEYSKLLSQEEDTSGRPNVTDQYLKVQTIDNGSGSYIVIETERWAIDDKEEWIALWDKHIEPMLKEVNKDTVTVVATPTLCVDLD